MIASHYQQISQHLQRCRHNVEFASIHLMPFNWDFNDRDVLLLGQQQQFNVENPCGQVLPWKYPLRS
jgi:hypothetical protein